MTNKVVKKKTKKQTSIDGSTGNFCFLFASASCLRRRAASIASYSIFISLKNILKLKFSKNILFVVVLVVVVVEIFVWPMQQLFVFLLVPVVGSLK